LAVTGATNEVNAIMTQVPYAPTESTAPRLMQKAAAILPYARYVPRHPAMMIGAAVLGLAGMLAWRNREKIKAAATPLLQNAAARGAELRERIPALRKSEPEQGQFL
jgi:hypothetical protein